MQPKSHTLFHFTKSGAVLQRILKEGFWPRYSLEEIGWLGIKDKDACAYPMACLCDIPLSRIDEHVAFYGSFGIGMSKEWSRKNGLNPVFCLAGQTPVVESVRRVFESTTGLDEPRREAVYKHVRYLLAHIKPTEGQVSVGRQPVAKEFYQESEWRYVPRHDDVGGYLLRPAFDDKAKLEEEDARTKAACMLRFAPSDVKYIFVPTDADIPAVINYIQTELDFYPSADLKVLMSRVTSLESVRDDL
jgi:hypothetical protein